jgi:hypothetical protein
MPTPLEIAHDVLATSPHDAEYLDLGDTHGWSDLDRVRVADAVMAAARQGDDRAPALLPGLLPRAKARAALEELLEAPDAGVRAQAGQLLLAFLQGQVLAALGKPLESMSIGSHALVRAIDLLLATGSRAYLRELLMNSAREDLRTAIIARLWTYERLDTQPQVSWQGLGLLERTLALPFASFRSRALPQLNAILDLGTPEAAGFVPPAPGAAAPPEMVAILRDIDGPQAGQGPVREELVAALPEQVREATLVFVVEKIVRNGRPRAVLYAARLGGIGHKDVLDWAAASETVTLAEAGRQALASITP